MTKKEKINKILKESHLIIVESTGLDISKSRRENARRESRKKLRELKDISPIIYERVKAEFNE
tara:strand:+ start:939 stop:1127 length:189 start_codon:yes stop_codon:yes gene_type:complete